jgi:hypothetical protein
MSQLVEENVEVIRRGYDQVNRQGPGGSRPRTSSGGNMRLSSYRSPDSSAGQSDSLLRSRPQVRILLGALAFAGISRKC